MACVSYNQLASSSARALIASEDCGRGAAVNTGCHGNARVTLDRAQESEARMRQSSLLTDSAEMPAPPVVLIPK